MKQLFLFAALLVASTVVAHAQCSDAVKKELEAFDRAWGEASERGDRAFLENALADDCANIGAGLMRGKKQIIDAQVAAAERRRKNPAAADKVTPDHYLITCSGNTATITHRNTIVWKEDGKEMVEYSRSVHFLEKRGGKWVVVSNVSNALDDAATLAYMEQDWNDADQRRDLAWFERNLAEDYSSVSSRDGALASKAEDIEDVRASKRTMELIELSDVRVRVEGNTALVTAVNHVKGKDGEGKAFDRRLRFTDTFVKRNGRWLAWATQGTEVQEKK